MEAEGHRTFDVIRIEARDLWVRPPGPRHRQAGFGLRDGYAVRGLDLALAAGEWLGVTGPNGGGKTSLLLALAGLWPPARGEVRIEGRAGRDRTGAVATVLQDPSAQLLQPTVLDEVAFAPRNLDHPAAESVARRWVERLGLGEFAASDPRHLSAGMQQLVLLAGALAAGPRILIADEPGAHLDAGARRLALEAVEEERGRGLTVVWATQDETELARSTRVLGLAEAGSPGDGIPSPGPRRGDVVMRLRVGPAAGLPGPRVATGEAIEIPIACPGLSALVGPNGSGKSVLLAAAAGILSTPQIEVTREAPLEFPPLLVSQYPERMFFEEVVRDEVCYAAVSRGRAREGTLEEAARAFESLGVDRSVLAARVWELPGGLKRLAETVAALVAPASLVLLDEPTAGLDRTRRLGLGRLVRDRAARSAVLVASQDAAWLAGIGASCVLIGAIPTAANPQQKNGLTEACGGA